MGNKQRKKQRPTRQMAASGKLILLCAIIVVVAMVSFVVVKSLSATTVYPQLIAIREHILKDNLLCGEIVKRLAQQSVRENFYVVFLSVCDSDERARVFTGTGSSIEKAWNNAEKSASVYMNKNKYNLLWVKADIVDSMDWAAKTDLNHNVVSTIFQNFFRKGIALDKDFDVAFLEAEISGNKLVKYYTEREIATQAIDFDADLLDLQNINFYLSRWRNGEGIEKTPDEIIVFTTTGFFCDENDIVYDLHNEGMYTGRRKIDTADGEFLSPLVMRASEYLYELIQPDGSFTYGYFPVFDNWMTSYNILRHGSSLWSLINLYRMTNDDSLIDGIDKGMAYLVSAMEYKDEQTAFLVERKSGEIKLGGNGIAIVAMTEYMDVFGSDKYIEQITHLANGILTLQNPSSGKFYHVLNYPDYTKKEEYRTVYYDGEATFALARAYGFTGKADFLEGARISVENFIINDFTQYRDHWVAYALHEITKYLPEQRYYEFALKNVENNLERIYNQTTSYHTYLELLAISWQTYERIVESGIEIEYLEGFDVEGFAETLYKRASYMLNSFFFPEYAMYMKVPKNALGAFFVRHDNFRIRIDDIQHFIGGYYYYIKNYDSISIHLSESFIKQMNSGEQSVMGGMSSEEMYDEG